MKTLTQFIAVIVATTMLSITAHAENCSYLETKAVEAIAKQHKVTVFRARVLFKTQTALIIQHANADVRFWLRNFTQHCLVNKPAQSKREFGETPATARARLRAKRQAGETMMEHRVRRCRETGMAVYCRFIDDTES